MTNTTLTVEEVPRRHTDSAAQSAVADAAHHFGIDVAHHTMTVLHAAGAWRHMRFRGDRSAYWFDIVTWPGVLVFNGDMGSYTFATGDQDVMVFFRGKQSINPGYWRQKVRGDMQVRAYSEDVFRERVGAALDDHADRMLHTLVVNRCLGTAVKPPRLSDEPQEAVAAECRPTVDAYMAALRAAVNAEVLSDECVATDADAYRALHAFTFDYHTGDDLWKSTSTPVQTFRFRDVWEWDLTDHTYQFLWACHAVVWAIGRYDDAMAAIREGRAANPPAEALCITEDTNWEAIAAQVGGELVNRSGAPGGEPETYLVIPAAR